MLLLLKKNNVTCWEEAKAETCSVGHFSFRNVSLFRPTVSVRPPISLSVSLPLSSPVTSEDALTLGGRASTHKPLLRVFTSAPSTHLRDETASQGLPRSGTDGVLSLSNFVRNESEDSSHFPCKLLLHTSISLFPKDIQLS